MTDHPTKYESYRTNDLREFKFTNMLKMHEIVKVLQILLKQNGGIKHLDKLFFYGKGAAKFQNFKYRYLEVIILFFS